MDSKVVRVVFTALLLDILAFTVILPLLPRLLQFYRLQEAGDESTILGRLLAVVNQYKYLISSQRATKDALTDKWDLVLLGGFVGSLFSFLQFLVSPYIGKISDSIGRRKTLLLTMIGNLISTVLWVFASSFDAFLWARIVGGLSEGNVQLSIAIISDVTDEQNRSKGLALVGIAFAIAFTIGPALGAYCASFDLTRISPALVEYGVYPFSSPALVALVLLSVEVIYIMAYLPETSNLRQKKETTDEKKVQPVESPSQISKRLATLNVLNAIHAFHLFIFSGMEFTLVFLTFDLFDYTNMQQGRLLGFIGIMSSLIQGGYVRRKAHAVGEKNIVLQGVVACTLGLLMFTMLALSRDSMALLYAGAFFFAVTSGTVVSCLTSLASMQCSDSDPRLAKGQALGVFRSRGQLGRAFGPLVACGVYWAYGPVVCYGLGTICMLIVTATVVTFIPQPQKAKKQD
ncbi:major facilitator superfamily domain-containing protein [Umbelopsis sp. AD052]|nr:major facilitator superfamily domain-containing protein [Umbelopsis sp. AD052]